MRRVDGTCLRLVLKCQQCQVELVDEFVDYALRVPFADKVLLAFRNRLSLRSVLALNKTSIYDPAIEIAQFSIQQHRRQRLLTGPRLSAQAAKFLSWHI